MRSKKTLWILAALLAVGIAGAIPLLRPVENTAYISGQLPHRTTDDLFQQSSLVALGQVTDISDAFRIESTSGGTAIYTDYTFTISRLVRGTNTAESVTVRVPGGTVDHYTEVYEPCAKLEKDGEYLLFLQRPYGGGAYNTAGDYYYVLGLAQGAFTAVDEEKTQFVSQLGVELDLGQMAMAYADEPVDENYARREFIENQQWNLESGFITQEEYDQFMAELDVYATILP